MAKIWCEWCKSYDPFARQCLEENGCVMEKGHEEKEEFLICQMATYINKHDIKSLMELVMEAINRT